MVFLTIGGILNPFISSSKFEFDLEQMRSMKTQIDDTAAELTDTKTKLLSSLTELETKWNTPAGKIFFEQKVNTEWVGNVDRYVSILQCISDLVNDAIQQYSQVENEIDSIKL